MSSPFKMTPKSGVMKAWKGSPIKQTTQKKKETKGKETDAERRDRLSVGKAGSGMQASAGQRKFAGGKIKANVGKQRGATDLAVEIPKAYNKAKKYIKGKLGMD